MVASKSAVDVFFSYAPRDEDLRPKLETHLDALKRQGVIRSYQGFALGGGRERREAVATKLREARVVLLLVSADFLHADSWFSSEILDAIARHEAGECRVIPVILRPCAWEKTPLGKLQPLPNRARPVTSYPNQSEAFTEIAKGIRSAAREPEPQTVRPQAARQKSSSPEAEPQVVKLPPRNPEFIGRDQLINDLRGALTTGGPAALTQAISGLGGVGKTQLAAEYAHRYASSYRVAWWVRAEEPATAAEDFAQLAAALGLPEKDEADQRVAIEAVRVWLSRNDKWLLIFDNVNDPKDLAPYLPHPRTGHILVTSRNPSWRGVATPLTVPGLDRADSVRFLLVRTGQSDEQAAANLAETLGDLPLALVQAAATIKETRSSIATYHAAFGDHQRELLLSGVPMDYPTPVATTWGLAFQEAQRLSPVAVDLLSVCAFLAPDDIPREGLVDAAAHLPPALAKALSDPFTLDDAVAALRRYSFIDVHEGALSVHRLVQAVVRDRLTSDDRRTWAEAAIRVVDHNFPESSDDVETWPFCARWLPHALAAATHAETYDVVKEVRGWLLARFAVYLQGRAAFVEAKGFLERALALHEAVYGQDAPKVAAVLRSLGSVFHDLGDLGGARGHLERALAIDIASFGPDHPDVARDVNDLGSVLMDQGDLAGARKHLERALAIDEATYGPDDPSVAIRLNNLGALFRDLGDFASARVHLERALAIDIRAYGREHPTVAIGRTNLGRLLHDLGDLKGAREQFEEALKIDEHSYGCYHPRFALALNNRGRVLRDLGDLAGARADFERALAIVEDTYGPDHPDVARDINNLGSVLRDLGDLDGARANFARVLRIAEATYGPDHPAVAIGCNNLGSVLQALGELPGAREQLERALGIAQATYGPDHPVVASIVNNLGRVLQALGDLSGAWQQLERAVAIATKALGPTHPSVQIFSRNLARLGDALGSADVR